MKESAKGRFFENQHTHKCTKIVTKVPLRSCIEKNSIDSTSELNPSIGVSEMPKTQSKQSHLPRFLPSLALKNSKF